VADPAPYGWIKSGREFYLTRNPPASRWRRRARAVIGDVLRADANIGADTAAVLRAVDAAYVDGSLSLSSERAAEIVAWLDERAPGRHNRPCPTCGRAKGKPCAEANQLTLTEPPAFGFVRVERKIEFVDRLIPHAARVQR
jgi:hypothetical protein